MKYMIQMDSSSNALYVTAHVCVDTNWYMHIHVHVNLHLQIGLVRKIGKIYSTVLLHKHKNNH